MYLRDVCYILKKEGVNHEIAIDDDNKKSHSNNENPHKITNSSQGKTLIQVSIELGLREEEASEFLVFEVKASREVI
jgi:hypothetical protein